MIILDMTKARRIRQAAEANHPCYGSLLQMTSHTSPWYHLSAGNQHRYYIDWHMDNILHL